MNRTYRDPGTDAPRYRLYRDRDNAIFFGVCAGLADYFGFNRKATRICVAVGGLFFFPTVLFVYVILGLVLDAAPSTPPDRFSMDAEVRRRVRSEPPATLRSVRHRYRELDRRLQRLEKYVTSKRYNLEREFDGLKD
jgi:phage shock protein C